MRHPLGKVCGGPEEPESPSRGPRPGRAMGGCVVRRPSQVLPAALVLSGLAMVPLPAAAQDVSLRWSGEIRLRTEIERPAPGGEVDAFTLMRTRLGVSAEVAQGAVLFVQLQDGRVFGEERSTTDATADAFDLHQGYAQLEWRRGELLARARAGRQELHLGSARFVGAPQWGNAGRSFDALRIDAEGRGGEWIGTLLLSTVQERGDRHGGAGGRPLVEGAGDHTLAGAIASAGVIEGFVFHDAGARYRSFQEVGRTTVGGRLNLPRLVMEGARQLGRHQTVRSAVGDTVRESMEGWFAGASLRVVGPATGTGSARVILGTEVYSGDDRPGDGRNTAFHTLYPSVHDIQGLMDLFTDPAAVTREAGLLDVFIRTSLPGVGPGSILPGSVAVDLHRFALARTGEGPGTLGWELDVVAPLRVSPAARVSLGYGVFRNGPAAPRIGFGDEGQVRHWGYAQASLAF